MHSNKSRLIFSSFNKRDVTLYSTPTTSSERFGLHDQCLQAKPEVCTHLDFDVDTDKGHAIMSSLEGYKTAYYVAMPQGDYMVRWACLVNCLPFLGPVPCPLQAWTSQRGFACACRVSFWDALVIGTIPVVFNTTFYQHLPFSDVVPYHDFVFFIDYEATLAPGAPTYVQMVQQQHDATRAQQKLEEMGRLAHLFQYSLNPDHSLITWNARGTIHTQDDAFTATMKAALRKLCSRGLSPYC